MTEDEMKALCKGYANVDIQQEAAGRIEKLEAQLAEAKRGLSLIAEHLPMFDYCGSDEHGSRFDIPGSPYDRGKEYQARIMSGIAARTLAKLTD